MFCLSSIRTSWGRRALLALSKMTCVVLWARDAQVQARVLSQDSDSMDPHALAINAASLALMLSNIPWDGPVG